MKVLHVIIGLNTGGAETALCRLLESLRSPAFEHVVVALGPEGALSARVGAVAELHHLGMRAGRATPCDVRVLRRLLTRAHPDVVQAWMYHANLMASLAAAGTGMPVVWGIHHSLTEFRRNKLALRCVIRACGALSRAPRRIVYCSAASRRQHEELGYARSRGAFIPNGTDVTAFQPDADARMWVRSALGITPDELTIGLVARVHPMKDHSNFVRAAAQFAHNEPRTRFVLVGEGADEQNAALARLVAGAGLAGEVILCGRRTDIAAVNNALDIASSSSWGEAFPLVLGEAMACGTPCAATDVGDSAEIIGDTGVVVRPRDPAALAAGWAKLAALGPDGRRALGLRARQRIIDRYSLTANALAYADLYRSLAGKGAVCAA